MGREPLELHADLIQPAGAERELVSGDEIQRRVQALVDADPRLRDCDKTIIAPMPKPTASESPTGCNWTMHYLGQFPGYEPFIDESVALVQHEVNIGRPSEL